MNVFRQKERRYINYIIYFHQFSAVIKRFKDPRSLFCPIANIARLYVRYKFARDISVLFLFGILCMLHDDSIRGRQQRHTRGIRCGVHNHRAMDLAFVEKRVLFRLESQRLEFFFHPLGRNKLARLHATSPLRSANVIYFTDALSFGVCRVRNCIGVHNSCPLARLRGRMPSLVIPPSSFHSKFHYTPVGRSFHYVALVSGLSLCGLSRFTCTSHRVMSVDAHENIIRYS